MQRTTVSQRRGQRLSKEGSKAKAQSLMLSVSNVVDLQMNLIKISLRKAHVI